MRSVQLANHLAYHVVHLFLVSNVIHQRLVNILYARPVHAMHIMIVETVLHHAPALVEYLLPLFAMIDFDACSKGNSARLATACARCCGRRGITSAAACAGQGCLGNVNHIEPSSS